MHCFNRKTDVFVSNTIERTLLFPKPSKDIPKGKYILLNYHIKHYILEEKKKELNFKILSKDEASFRPIISPNGKKIAYFGAPISPPHLNYLAMKIINVDDWSVEEILPIKKENLSETGEFMGVCGFYDDLKNFFWLNDNKHFVLTTNIKGSLGTFLVNTETKEIYRFQVNSTHSDVF